MQPTLVYSTTPWSLRCLFVGGLSEYNETWEGDAAIVVTGVRRATGEPVALRIEPTPEFYLQQMRDIHARR